MYDFLLIANLVIFALVAYYYVQHPAANVYHPASWYLAFHGLLFVIRPIMSRYYGYRYIYVGYQFEPSMSDKQIVIVAACLGMLCFVFGALQSGNVAMQFRRSAANELHRRLLFKPTVIALAITVPIGIASLAAHWRQRTYKLNTMVLDSATGIAINTDKNGYFVEAQLMLVPATVLFAWLFRFRWWSLIPLAFFIVVRAGTGGRGPFVVAAATVALLMLYQREWKWPTWKSLGMLVAIAILFNAVGNDRGQSIRDALNQKSGSITDQERDSNILYPMEGMDFGNLEYFEYLVYAVPQRTGTYEYFTNQLVLFTEPIPRVLWKDKPIGSPIKMFSLFDYGRPMGMTRSLPGEGWTQLGWFGVVLWCTLWGYVLGWIYRRFVQSGQATIPLLFYNLMLSTLMIAFRDGGPVTTMRLGVFYFSPLILLWAIARMMAIPTPQALERILAMHKMRAQRNRAVALGELDNARAAPERSVPRGHPKRSRVLTRSERARLKLLGRSGPA